jgi:hypothetical protein
MKNVGPFLCLIKICRHFVGNLQAYINTWHISVVVLWRCLWQKIILLYYLISTIYADFWQRRIVAIDPNTSIEFLRSFSEIQIFRTAGL